MRAPNTSETLGKLKIHRDIFSPDCESNTCRHLPFFLFNLSVKRDASLAKMQNSNDRRFGWSTDAGEDWNEIFVKQAKYRFLRPHKGLSLLFKFGHEKCTEVRSSSSRRNLRMFASIVTRRRHDFVTSTVVLISQCHKNFVNLSRWCTYIFWCQPEFEPVLVFVDCYDKRTRRVCIVSWVIISNTCAYSSVFRTQKIWFLIHKSQHQGLSVGQIAFSCFIFQRNLLSRTLNADFVLIIVE